MVESHDVGSQCLACVLLDEVRRSGEGRVRPASRSTPRDFLTNTPDWKVWPAVCKRVSGHRSRTRVSWRLLREGRSDLGAPGQFRRIPSTLGGLALTINGE